MAAAADKHGLRTVCALPLVLGDDVIGVLNIYSGEPGTFGPNEVAVLSRLADDLAYGIGRLRDSDCLTRNEALLRAAEHLAHVGHWEWDLHSGLFTFMADEIFTIYGITHSGFEGSLEAALAFVPAEDRRIVQQAIDDARFNYTTEVEHRIVRPDGEVRFVRTRSEAIGNGDARPVRDWHLPGHHRSEGGRTGNRALPTIPVGHHQQHGRGDDRLRLRGRGHFRQRRRRTAPRLAGC